MNIYDACESAYKRGYEDGKLSECNRTFVRVLPWLRLIVEDGRIIGWYNPRIRRPLR